MNTTIHKVLITLIYCFALFTSTILPQEYVISKNNIKYQVQDITDLISKSLLKAYRNLNIEDIAISDLSFSPSGQYLAFTVYNVIWLLDLNSQKVKRVSPPVYPGLIHPSIQNFYWSYSDVIFAKIDILNSMNRKFDKQIYMCANMEFTSYALTPLLNVDENKSFRQNPSDKFTLNHSGFILESTNKKSKIKQSLRFKDGYLDEYLIFNWSQDGETFVFTDNKGHGDIGLYAGYTRPDFYVNEIVRGSWELERYDFSKNNPYMVYPNKKNMVFYDYRKKKIIDEIDFGTYVGNFSWSKNNQIAFWQSGGKRKPFLWRLKILQFK